MNTKLKFLAAGSLLAASCFFAQAQGTAFTYQGQLNNNGSPATGLYDIQFSLSNAPSGGSQVGTTVTNLAVGVTNGLFTTRLDFGAVFTGNANWLAIRVRTNGVGSYVGLDPLQPLTPTPYAEYSAAAGNALTANSAGSVSAGNIVGTLPLAQLPTVVLTNGASGVNVSGTFAGNGVALTNLPLSSLASSSLLGWGGFTLASSPAVGANPNCVVTADVNGDGKVGVIVGSRSGLTVLTNNGSGGLVLAETLILSEDAVALVAADVNGDGKPDLITADNGGLTVLTNEGAGGFALAARIPANISPWGYQSLVAADIYGTGKPALIVANQAGTTQAGITFSVFNNHGGGNFSLAATIEESTDPSAQLQNVVAADINGDGLPDLICITAFEPPAVTVLTNNGSGGFAISGTYPIISPTAIAAADVNGDGKVDVIVGGYYGLTVLTNNGTGGLVQATTVGSGSYYLPVCASDVNGDGKMDLIAANVENDTLSVFTNDGSGGFALAATPSVGNWPVEVVAADVNGDGKVDLLTVNGYDNTLSVVLNCPSYLGTFAGNGSGLTELNATNLTGTVPDTALSADVALLDGNQTFTGTNIFAVPYNRFTGQFSGNGAGLTNLNAVTLTGSVPVRSLTSVPAGSLTGTILPANLGTTNSYVPTIGDGTHDFTTTTHSGYYSVVGDLVYFEVWLEWTGKNAATSTSAVQISLPVQVVSQRAAFTVAFFNGVSFSHQLTALAITGENYILLDDLTPGGAAASILVGSCGASGEVQIAGTYRWQ